ncbi:MAG: cation transporter [Ruminococcaceae bacterium]|nr:cation transporter [Oscillospiraceae bacterium]
MGIVKKMHIAFLLNLSFAVFELVGGVYTGSIAIISDALHDFFDALSIGISCYLEKKSKKSANSTYTYGYLRYSVLGAAITNCILVIGSVAVMYNAVMRIFNPVPLNRGGMIIIALFGIIANLAAVYFTKGGDSLNQKAVNLHMGEDVLCWVAILVGGIIIEFTGFTVIDALLSFGVGMFILISAALSMGKIINLFLEKAPKEISVEVIRDSLTEMPQVLDVHHVHVRSFDGISHCATMHIVTDCTDIRGLKCRIKKLLFKFGIEHTTLEFETPEEMHGESGEIWKIESPKRV